MKHWKLKALVMATSLGVAAMAGAQTYYGSKELNTLPGTSKAYPGADRDRGHAGANRKLAVRGTLGCGAERMHAQ